MINRSRNDSTSSPSLEGEDCDEGGSHELGPHPFSRRAGEEIYDPSVEELTTI
jgi:hypothetical protein